MHSFLKTLWSFSSIFVFGTILIGCGENGFLTNPDLQGNQNLSSENSSNNAVGFKIRDGYVVIGDMIVHRNQVDSADLQKYFPNQFKARQQDAESSGVFEDNIQLWPDGVLPLAFNGFSSGQQRTILEYCEELGRSANIRCKRREGERDYVFVRASSSTSMGCGYSYYGRVGGQQEMMINRSPLCFTERTIKHEIMHALGVGHEMNRSDRDDHVNIIWENIRSGGQSNFAKIQVNTTKTSQYDFDSIMHYSSNAFQKQVGQYTILRKQRVRVAPSNCQAPNPSYPDEICRRGGMTDIIPLNRVPSSLDNQILALEYGSPNDANRDEAEAFVNSVYQKYFNRNAETNGLNYWADQMVYGQKPQLVVEKDILFGASANDQQVVLDNHADLARDFLLNNNFALPEYLMTCNPNSMRLCANISNGSIYSTCNAQGSGYGSCSVVQCNAGYTLSGGSCIANQTQQPPANNQDQMFINSVYQKYFNRDAEMSGLTYWVSQLSTKSRLVVEKDIIFNAGSADRNTVLMYNADRARSFLLSNGFSIPNYLAVCTPYSLRFCNNIANGSVYASCNYQGSGYGSCSFIVCDSGYEQSGSSCVRIPTQEDLNREFISSVYMKYFNRSPESGGLNFWMSHLANNSRAIVERDIIFGAQDSANYLDRTYLTLYRASTARSFLMANGFDIPDWLN